MTKRLFFLLPMLFAGFALSAQIYEPVKWIIEKKVTSPKTFEIIFTAKIDDGWHVYGTNIPENGPRPTSVAFEKLENAQKVGNLESPSEACKEYDVNFDMELTWYKNEAVFIQKFAHDKASKVTVEGYVEFMVCNDQTCLPPTQEHFSFKSGAAAVSSPVSETTESSGSETEVSPQDITSADARTDYWTPVTGELQNFGGESGNAGSWSLWFIFLAGLAGGFIALFTPCVWPIIPMTVSFFLKRSENKSRGRRDAILYGLSIIIIYITLGILITLIFGASALNSLSTSAVFNLFFFALLALFAVSFFGAFEITLPSSWSTKIDAKAENTAGFLSILLMAFTLVLVSFSCTGPIIGTVLVEVAGSGSILSPAIAMLGFATALSIPFTLFAIFPSWLKSMPKSGGWLNTIKVVLAFLELALALKFLSVADLAYGWRILDREVFIALWIVIFFLLGLYLLGKIRFPHDSEKKHTSVLGVFLAIISLSFSVYMIPGLWGAPLKAVSAFAPPLYTQDFNLYNKEVHPAFTDYDLGMAYAAEQGKPVVLDFTGYGCVNCREMEASVWLDPEVKELLTGKYVLISVYVDDKTPLAKPYTVTENGKTRKIKTVGDKWSYLQRYKFGANAQPFYVMLDNEGKPVNTSYAYDKDPRKFAKWLKRL
ncbi:MAG: thioredoxin family protein [Prevotellaceae bacterium]|jgi:thiol:disulfide interchange protein DsbD|nr:thioredoxin family protein [Prevotellaceae bacterium]